MLGGRYELGAVLGRGGMARVHRARDTVLGRDVAVKVFRLGLDAAEAGRVEQEIRTLASLSHPGLVAVYDAGSTADTGGEPEPYLVMELVDGPTLATALADGGPLHPARAAAVGADLAAALAYVHARGIVHRDVKPANVLLGPDGRTRLTDFGIARLVDTTRHTATGLLVGTAPYLSPEQVSGVEVGPPTDVYALGLLLLEALTGHPAYAGTGPEVALARLTRAPEVPDALPAPWPGLLRAMTAADPAARPAAAEVAVVLRSAGAGPGAGADTGPDVGVLSSAPPPAPRPDVLAVPPDVPTGPPPHVPSNPVGAVPPPRRAAEPARAPSLVGGLLRDRVVWTLTGALVVVVGAVVLGLRTLAGLGAGGGEPDPAAAPAAAASGTPSASPAATAGPLAVAGVALFHPGGSGADKPQDVGLAADGDPATAWTTQRYASREFGNLRPGVGLRFDLGAPREVRSVRVVLPRAGAGLRLHAGDDGGDGLLDTPALAARPDAPADLAVDLPRPTTARYWVVWLDRLPPGGRGGIAEVRFLP